MDKVDHGSEADVTFEVKPDPSLGGRNFSVVSWSVDGQERVREDKHQYKVDLSYNRRYVISADVTVDGKKQKVLPYQWNYVDAPVWMISRVGKSDREYQLLCTNSSNIKYKVKQWAPPVFQNEKLEVIPAAQFQCNIQPGGDNDTRLSLDWKQNYTGVYVMVLEADVETIPDPGQESRKAKVRNSFVLINGSDPEPLIRSKFFNAKKRIYHCLATNMDGTLQSGTAFAVSDRLLLTNYHVAVGNIPEYYGGGESSVDPKKVLILSNEDKQFYAKVCKSDRATDLALLKLCDANGNDTSDRLPESFRLAEQEPAEGVRLFSGGYPAGTTPLGAPAFVDGKVEKCESNDSRGSVIYHFSNIQPGYSGGPLVLLDDDQVVVGINSCSVNTETPLKQGINIATSAAEIRRKFPEIVE